VRIDGLVCAACAARTRTALERLPGVRAARVDLAHGTATLEFESNEHSINAADLDRALRSVVVGMWFRRLIEHSINPADLDRALRSVVVGMWFRRLIEHSINRLVSRLPSSTREGRA
jgi:copper chaperone CopZ